VQNFSTKEFTISENGNNNLLSHFIIIKSLRKISMYDLHSTEVYNRANKYGYTKDLTEKYFFITLPMS